LPIILTPLRFKVTNSPTTSAMSAVSRIFSMVDGEIKICLVTGLNFGDANLSSPDPRKYFILI
jgi:hypothetical protein